MTSKLSPATSPRFVVAGVRRDGNYAKGIAAGNEGPRHQDYVAPKIVPGTPVSDRARCRMHGGAHGSGEPRPRKLHACSLHSRS
jgi:hypothetical protein